METLQVPLQIELRDLKDTAKCRYRNGLRTPKRSRRGVELQTGEGKFARSGELIRLRASLDVSRYRAHAPRTLALRGLIQFLQRFRSPAPHIPRPWRVRVRACTCRPRAGRASHASYRSLHRSA